MRLGCAAVVWAAPVSEDAPHAHADGDAGLRVVRIESLSLSGLAFISLHAYALDTPVWVRVRLGAKTCQFKGVVRRASAVTRAGRAWRLYGVQFVRSQQTAHAVAAVSLFIESASFHHTH